MDSSPFSIKYVDQVLLSRKRSSHLTKPIFFYHIPKAAGTNFRWVISCAQAFKRHQTEASYLMGKTGEYCMWDSEITPEYFADRFASLFMWKPFGIHNNFAQNFNLVTVVREPCQRLVSRYRFLCNSKGFTPSPELFEIFFRAAPQQNHQAKLLAGVEDEKGSHVELYDRAKENLEHFIAVATINNVNILMENLLSAYDLPNVIGQRLNVSPPKSEFAWQPYRQEILDLNQGDVMLFDHVAENQKLISGEEASGPGNSEADINERTLILRRELEQIEGMTAGFRGESTAAIVEDSDDGRHLRSSLEDWLRDSW